ncbi:T9SS type A sorting domain-containing protein [Flavobacterium sp. N3904]|uniref:T9SS type A sorting domain-containing protein n=1 Tax=Flavobacterium sp. N3904 TaxID=2986835 RepID=UPI002225A35B|nr:T9SS type A sorting domain-containing protein [Flavobacterium sp. N3904]
MKKIITLLILHFSLLCFSQSGTIDYTFNPLDVGYGNAPGANSNVLDSSLQTDGKIVIVGNFNSYNDTACKNIARLNVDGSLDRSFNPDLGTDKDIQTISIQSDGKIIIGGEFTSYNGTPRNHIARLNPDGSLDESFNPNLNIDVDTSITTSLIQNDGKIIIGGYYYEFGSAMTYIIRLNTNGSIDNSFSSGVPPKGLIHTTSIQNDGKIVVGGVFYNTAETNRTVIVRLNSNGSLDSNFPIQIGNQGEVVSTTSVQSDGKIIMGGNFGNGKGIFRLNPDGSLDSSFSIDKDFFGGVSTTATQSDGKILIGGDFGIYKETIIHSIARLNTDGSLDAGFDPRSLSKNPVNGKDESYYNGGVSTVLIQPSGGIIIGGHFGGYNATNKSHIVKLKADGSLDFTFNPQTAADDAVSTVALQADNKIIIGGNFKRYNGKPTNHIARLNDDGSQDMTFNPDLLAEDIVSTLFVQPDGKIIIGGGYVKDGVIINSIIRLNSDGSKDTSFNPGSGANGNILSISYQTDGKIIIGGYFGEYNGTVIKNIARLNSDGSLDNSFQPGNAADNGVWHTALQSDGKILIGGVFTNTVARLNINGSLDTSFNPRIKNIFCLAIAVQSDGKIIIGGSYSGNSNIQERSISRLNSDGSLDTSFNPGTGPNGSIYTISLQSDGKIIAAGDFKQYNDTEINSIVCLNKDGSLETNFNPGTSINQFSSIKSSAIQSDGKIIIGGDFTSYNTIGRNRIARIYANDNVPINEQKDTAKIILYPNPTKSNFQLFSTTKQQGAEYTIIDFSGKEVSRGKVEEGNSIDIHNLLNGLYLLKVGNKFISKFIKE